MPKILDSAIRKIKKTWKTKEQSYAIAVSTLQKAKIIDKKWNLTALWKKREALGSKGRAKESVAETKKSMKKKTVAKKR